jgi:hypothetical protein
VSRQITKSFGVLSPALPGKVSEDVFSSQSSPRTTESCVAGNMLPTSYRLSGPVVYVRAPAGVHTRIFTHTRIRICTHVHTHTYIHTHARARAYAHSYTHTHTHVYTRTHTCVRTRVQTHTHILQLNTNTGSSYCNFRC